jgi:hypothetical protein
MRLDDVIVETFPVREKRTRVEATKKIKTQWRSGSDFLFL